MKIYMRLDQDVIDRIMNIASQSSDKTRPIQRFSKYKNELDHSTLQDNREHTVFHLRNQVRISSLSKFRVPKRNDQITQTLDDKDILNFVSHYQDMNLSDTEDYLSKLENSTASMHWKLYLFLYNISVLFFISDSSSFCQKFYHFGGVDILLNIIQYSSSINAKLNSLYIILNWSLFIVYLFLYFLNYFYNNLSS